MLHKASPTSACGTDPLEEEIWGLLPLDMHPSPSKMLCHGEVGKK